MFYDRCKRLALLMALTMLLSLLPGISVRAAESDWPSEPELSASSAIVVEMNTGAILYEKNVHDQHYPASITKILTTLLGLEYCDPDETVTFSATAVYDNEGSTSNIARDLGEEMTVEQTLYAIMLESANECAWAIAEHVGDKLGGGEPAFVDLMNERAAELGCTDTHFNNPNGLPDEEHYTSAYDMMLIAVEAYKNETFRTITGTKTYTIPPTNKHKDATPLNNHHKCLHTYRTSAYVNPYVVGGKTGFTEAANGTLVTYAAKDGMEICVVVMDVEDPLQFAETNTLIDYVFDNFSIYNISDNEESLQTGASRDMGLLNNNKGFITVDGDATLILPVGADLGEVGCHAEESTDGLMVSYTYDDHKVGEAAVTKQTADPVETVFEQRAWENAQEGIVLIQPFSLIIVGGTGLTLALLALLIWEFHRLRKRFLEERRRQENMRKIRRMRRTRKSHLDWTNTKRTGNRYTVEDLDRWVEEERIAREQEEEAAGTDSSFETESTDHKPQGEGLKKTQDKKRNAAQAEANDDGDR